MECGGRCAPMLVGRWQKLRWFVVSSGIRTSPRSVLVLAQGNVWAGGGGGGGEQIFVIHLACT